MKKFLSLLLIISMVFAFIACSTQTEENDTSESENTTKADTTSKAKDTKDGKTSKKNDTTKAVTEENPFKDFFEITWLTQYNTDFQEGRWDEAELEEKFNVDLQVWTQNGVKKEQMAPLFAAGDIPDFYFAPGAPLQPEEQYEQGVTRSINIEAIRDWLPGYYELLEKLPIGFKYNLVPGTTDEYIGITHCNISGCQYFYDAACINLDWLDAIGYGFDESELTPVKMTVDGYEKFNDNIYFAEGNFTFEEYNDILKQFTEEDPDGNGADDTIGMIYLRENHWTQMTQQGLFGYTARREYLYKDPVTGDVVPNYAFTPYRDYWKWVSESLQKGYMKKLPGEKSWIVEYAENTQTNKVGIMAINGGGYLSLNNETYKAWPPQNILTSNDEDARFVVGPMFLGPNGECVDYTYNVDPYGTGTYRVQMIGKQVDDAKLKRIFQILQYTTFSSEDNYIRYKNGIEGIHWKWAGEPYESYKIATPESELPEKYRGQLNVFGLWVFPSKVQFQIDNAENNGYWSYMPFMHANGLFEKYAINPAKYASAVYMGYDLYDKYQELMETYSEEMNPIISDFKNRALKGEIANFDTEWEQYIDQLYTAGLETLIKEIYNNPDFKNYDPGEKFTLR